MKSTMLALGTALWLITGAVSAYAHEDVDWDKALPDNKRELLHKTMEQVRKQNEPLILKEKDVYQQMRAVLTAPKFDKEKFLSRHKELVRLKMAIHDNMCAGFAEVAPQLSPDEREIVAQHMDAHWKHLAEKAPEGKRQESEGKQK
ncbi:MAG TPA: periplasmic heavy metal sensor [Rickettsiales bacterium]|nr:periplasmic heavy metal sensor [Rickettsiales bacterium]